MNSQLQKLMALVCTFRHYRSTITSIEIMLSTCSSDVSRSTGSSHLLDQDLKKDLSIYLVSMDQSVSSPNSYQRHGFNFLQRTCMIKCCLNYKPRKGSNRVQCNQ